MNEKNILIVSHGCILSLYFTKLFDRLDQTFEGWKKTGFWSLGIVRGGKVVEDIV